MPTENHPFGTFDDIVVEGLTIFALETYCLALSHLLPEPASALFANQATLDVRPCFFIARTMTSSHLSNKANMKEHMPTHVRLFLERKNSYT